MKILITKGKFLAALLTIGVIPIASFAQEEKMNPKNKSIHPTVTHQVIELAKKNSNWKVAFLTGKHNQVVFMNVSPSTNPKNEIGMETHPFDQIIFIAEGNGKADLKGEELFIKSGDMIFIPENTPHNVINLNQGKDLKIISIYSDTDIPAHSVYKKKESQPVS